MSIFFWNNFYVNRSYILAVLDSPDSWPFVFQKLPFSKNLKALLPFGPWVISEQCSHHPLTLQLFSSVCTIIKYWQYNDVALNKHTWTDTEYIIHRVIQHPHQLSSYEWYSENYTTIKSRQRMKRGSWYPRNPHSNWGL